jgi:glycosyltransferase involved in cell wall biosynthesis
MKILFLAPYPLRSSPSQRFRFEQYFKALGADGHSYVFQSFLSSTGWKNIYSKGRQVQKAWAIVSGFLRRLVVLPKALNSDVVFIHRELTPLGPPIFEWLIAKGFGKKIVYDFDDAIWLTDRKNESWFGRMLRWRSKVAMICRWSAVVSCGNEFLCGYARNYNLNVRYNPTTIDLNYHKLMDQRRTNDEIIIGWTGSHSTLKYLDSIVPVIRQLEKKYSKLIFEVIADQKPDLDISSLRFIPWKEETEIEDLSTIDIGIMPLPDDEWSKGKCGFKLLQYMSLEKASIASPVGVNTAIITNGIDGLICNDANEWIEAIGKLIDDANLRRQLGEAGRRKVETSYSVSSNSANFLLLFKSLAINTRATR